MSVAGKVGGRGGRGHGAGGAGQASSIPYQTAIPTSGRIAGKAVEILTVCEVLPIDPAILRSGSRGWEGRVSECARACRVSDTVSPRLGHRHARADRTMRRGEARRTERQGSYSQGEGGLTLSLLRLQALLARPSRFHERVGNGDTFKTCYCTPSDSNPLGNGGGVPVSGTYAPAPGTHPSSRN